MHCLPEKQAQDPASSLTSAVTVQNSNRAPEAFEDLFTVINSLLGAEQLYAEKFQDDAWGVAA